MAVLSKQVDWWACGYFNFIHLKIRLSKFLLILKNLEMFHLNLKTFKLFHSNLKFMRISHFNHIVSYTFIYFLFFYRESFNLWRPLLMIAFYHQTKTPISFWCRSFWCRRGLNLRSLIQPSETLPVELTGTHFIYFYLNLRVTGQISFKTQSHWIQLVM